MRQNFRQLGRHATVRDDEGGVSAPQCHLMEEAQCVGFLVGAGPGKMPFCDQVLHVMLHIVLQLRVTVRCYNAQLRASPAARR